MGSSCGKHPQSPVSQKKTLPEPSGEKNPQTPQTDVIVRPPASTDCQPSVEEKKTEPVSLVLKAFTSDENQAPPAVVLNNLLLLWCQVSVDGAKTQGTSANTACLNQYTSLFAPTQFQWLGLDSTQNWDASQYTAEYSNLNFGLEEWPVANSFTLNSFDEYSQSAIFWGTTIVGSNDAPQRYYKRMNGQMQVINGAWYITQVSSTLCIPNAFFFDVLTTCGYPTGADMPIIGQPPANPQQGNQASFVNTLDQTTYWSWQGVQTSDGAHNAENFEAWSNYIVQFGQKGPVTDPNKPTLNKFNQWIGTDATETWANPAFRDAVGPTYKSGDSREFFGWIYNPDSAGYNTASVDNFATQGSFWQHCTGWKDYNNVKYSFPTRIYGNGTFTSNLFLPPTTQWLLSLYDLSVMIPPAKLQAVLAVIYPPGTTAPVSNFPVSDYDIQQAAWATAPAANLGTPPVTWLQASNLGTNGATPFQSADGMVTIGTPGQATNALMDTGCSLAWIGSADRQAPVQDGQAFYNKAICPWRKLFNHGNSTTYTPFQTGQPSDSESKSTAPRVKQNRFKVGAPRPPNLALKHHNHSKIEEKGKDSSTSPPVENTESFGPWGSIESILGNDVVTLANNIIGASPTTLEYIIAEAITAPSPITITGTEFAELRCDGFIGMAFTNTDPRYPEEHTTFLDRIEKSGFNKLVSFDFKNANMPYCYPGGVPPSLTWQCLPVRHTMLGGQYWDIITDGIYVGTDPTNQVQNFGYSGQVYQIFDTGASFLKLNPDETTQLLRLQFGDNFDTAVDQTKLAHHPGLPDDYLGLAVINDSDAGQPLTFQFRSVTGQLVSATIPTSVQCMLYNADGSEAGWQTVSPIQALVGLPPGQWVFGNVINQDFQMVFDSSQQLDCIWVNPTTGEESLKK